MLDHLLLQMLRHLVAYQRQHDFVAGDDNLGNVLALDDLLERFDDLLDVLQVEVLDVALVAGLRPAALRRALRLDARDLFLRDDLAGREDHDARSVRVGEHDRA